MTGLDKQNLSSLVIGYRRDALDAISMHEQILRLFRWRRQGWSPKSYHMNILAMVIGYRQAKEQMSV